MTELWGKAASLEAAQEPFVCVTLVTARGHVPQEPGAKALITKEGLVAGTIGGGKVEARAIRLALDCLEGTNREPRLLTWNLQRDVGMTCGGEVTLLFEIHDANAWQIAVFGAGHVSQALVRTLNALDCRIRCIDAREEWLGRLPDNPRISRRLDPDWAAMNASTFFIVMTQGHATDVPVLAEIYRRFPDAPYVGVMGSDVKAKKIRGELLDLGIPRAQVERLKSPIGLKIGGNTPAEIAISVTAELLAERDLWRGKLKLASSREESARPSNRDSEQTLF